MTSQNKYNLIAIVLTYNEELHIERCIKNLKLVCEKVYVVDSFSTDQTCNIAKKLGAEIVQHEWPGNQAEQFNWAIDNIEVDTEWVLRLDADEYLMPELIEELREKLLTLPSDVTGVEFKRRHIFMGRWVKHGIYPVIMLRMFRNGYGRYEERLMDEHLSLLHGRCIRFNHDFCDHSLMNISEFCRKHVNYAEREAVELLDVEFNLSGKQEDGNVHKGDGQLADQAEKKHRLKALYAKKPLFWRSAIYFLYRYFVKGAFLEGKAGFVFTFIQGWWYRTMVDVNIYEAKKACGNDKEKLKKYIQENWKITL